MAGSVDHFINLIYMYIYIYLKKKVNKMIYRARDVSGSKGEKSKGYRKTCHCYSRRTDFSSLKQQITVCVSFNE